MANQWAMERAFYEGVEKDREIDRLKALVARLTAPFGPEDAEVVYRVNGAWIENVHPDYAEALFTAFLERRMKG